MVVVTAVRLPRPQEVLLRTDTGHVREDNVDVDFQLVSPRRVDIQLRVNLWGANRRSAGQPRIRDSTNSTLLLHIMYSVLFTHILSVVITAGRHQSSGQVDFLVHNLDPKLFPSILRRVQKGKKKKGQALVSDRAEQAGEAHLLGEIILQLRNKQDQHDHAADDGHCRDGGGKNIKNKSTHLHGFINRIKWLNTGAACICITHVCLPCTINTFLLY